MSLLPFSLVVAGALWTHDPPLPAANPGRDADEEGAEVVDLEEDDFDLTELSLEELMDIEVTIASRTSQPLGDSPAAVYVLTGDEIRRAGHTSIPEALRMVPGFQVARVDSSSWSVTARGFSGGFANQLLVMIDGISVYTPLFAGVWWHLQGIDLADVDRIEIIRGPGATLWGANAVNGIVNVITKHSSDTQGALLTGLFGDEEKGGTIRYGGPLGEDAWYRVWALGFDHDALVDAQGEPANEEDWRFGRVGFRADWDSAENERLKLLGNAYVASIGEQYFVANADPALGQTVVDDTPKTGAMLLGSWEKEDSADSSLKLEAWYSRDHQKRVDLSIAIDTWDVDFQRTKQLSERNTLVWGLGYRLVRSDLEGDFTLTFDPTTRRNQTFRAYVQDEIRFPDQNLRLIFGSQFEHNDYTGFEFQPNVRFTWNPAEDQTVWGAVSRAVRTPSLEENDSRFNAPVSSFGAFNTFLTSLGSDDVEAEDLLAYELGYRVQPLEEVSVDLTAFYNDYDDIQTLEFVDPFFEGSNLFVPFEFDNKAEAASWGAELAVDWNVSDDWRIRSAWTYFRLDSEIDDDSTDVFFFETDDSSPRNQVNLRSYYDLGDHWELDVGLYYVDDVPFKNNPNYFRTDLRLGYNPSEDLRFSIGVQNLTDDRHPEDGPGAPGLGTEVERNVYFNLSWRP